jgi:hypothetical protein
MTNAVTAVSNYHVRILMVVFASSGEEALLRAGMQCGALFTPNTGE